MSAKKLIASIVLLLTYTVGLAHEIIPHCHHNTVSLENSSYHVVEHSHHSCELTRDHAHFSHRNHCDSGLLDFVTCLMSETEHPVNCTERSLYLPSMAHDLSTNQTIKLLVSAAILTTGYALLPRFVVVPDNVIRIVRQSAHCLETARLRGPPLISC